MKSQDSIKGAIKNYLEAKETDYAIMLTGEWGSGKTYFVRTDLQELLSETEFKLVYISLNGLRDVEEIYKQLFLANNDKFQKVSESKTGKYALRGISKAFKFAKVDLDNFFDPSDFVKLKEKTLICFDDLERLSCSELITSVLGEVHQLVETLGAKVLFVSNEKKIDGIDEIKEKTIGYTYRYEMSHGEMIDMFTEFFSGNEAYFTFLKSNRKYLLRLFSLREKLNLRILKRMLTQYQMIHAQCVYRNKEHLVFYNFITLFVEFETGENDKESLIRYYKDDPFYFSFQYNRDDAEKDKKSYPKSFELDFFDGYEISFLRIGAIVEYIENGYLNKQVLKEQLDNLFGDGTDEDVRAFNRLIKNGYYRLPDEEFIELTNLVLEITEKGTWNDPSWYLAIYKAFSMFSDEGLISDNTFGIKAAVMNGLNKLAESDRLDLMNYDLWSSGETLSEPTDSNYQEVKEHLMITIKEIEDKTLSGKSKKVLSLLKGNGSEFFRTILSDYQSIPIFKNMNVDDLYSKINNCQNEAKRDFVVFLNDRYNSGYSAIKEDRETLERLSRNLVVKIEAENQLSLSKFLMNQICKKLTSVISGMN